MSLFDCHMTGMTINLWGDDDPISLPMFNVNYSQTRITRCPAVYQSSIHASGHDCCISALIYIYICVYSHHTPRRHIYMSRIA